MGIRPICRRYVETTDAIGNLETVRRCYFAKNASKAQLTPLTVRTPDPLAPTAFEHMITKELKGLDGLAAMLDEIDENPSMRRAMVLRAATNLRDRLQNLSYEASCSEPVTIEAQDAAVLLDLLLRRIG